MRQFRGVARGRKSGLKFGAREEAEGTKIKLMGDWIKERNGEVKPTANSGLPLPHHGKEHSDNSIAYQRAANFGGKTSPTYSLGNLKPPVSTHMVRPQPVVPRPEWTCFLFSFVD